MKKHLIWVRTCSGSVIGFPPAEIAEFELAFKKIKYSFDAEDRFDMKWAYFNEYFEDDLGFSEADGYSALWYDGEAWEEMEEIMGRMEQAAKKH